MRGFISAVDRPCPCGRGQQREGLLMMDTCIGVMYQWRAITKTPCRSRSMLMQSKAGNEKQTCSSRTRLKFS